MWLSGKFIGEFRSVRGVQHFNLMTVTALSRLLLVLGLFALAKLPIVHAQTQEPNLDEELPVGTILPEADADPKNLVELWNFNDQEGGGNYANTLQLRYYRTLDFSNGHKATLRLDTSTYAQYGSAYPNQNIFDTKSGTTKITLSSYGPRVSETIKTTVGLRGILPVGASNQWVIGPHAGFIYMPNEGNGVFADFSPIVRYYYGFDPKSPTPTPVRSVNFFPTLGINLTQSTQLRFWDENPIVFNVATGKSFVPIDALVIHQFTKRFFLTIGASRAVISDNFSNNHSIYGNVAYRF